MYRRNGLFWGLLLVALAFLLLLQKLGRIEGNAWGYFWALALIFLGLWFIGAYLKRNQPIEGQEVAIPLEGASSAKVSLDHGAGRLNVRGGAPSGMLFSGTFSGGLNVKSHRQDDRLSVRLRNPADLLTWSPGVSLDWDVRLNADIPLRLEINSGASAAILDLSDLRVTELDLKTGASRVEVTLPARAGETRVKVESGVSAVKISIPQTVAARIRVETGISAVNIDRDRFLPQDGHIYQSLDFSTADNRVDLEIEAGVGAVDIF